MWDVEATWRPGWPTLRSMMTRSLRLQYLAGLSLNDYNQDAIYSAILSYNKFPDDLFTGPPELKAAVRNGLETTRRSGAKSLPKS